MKVILQKDIPTLGDAGDIREVAEGYARNFLLPRKLVIIADDSSRKNAEHQKKLIKLKKDKRRKESEKVSSAISALSLVIQAQVGEEGKLFGSVTSMDIAKKLSEAGFPIDKRKIALESPIRQTGEFTIPVKLEEGLTASVKLTVQGL